MNKKFLYAITIVVILALGGCGKKESLIKPYDISSLLRRNIGLLHLPLIWL